MYLCLPAQSQGRSSILWYNILIPPPPPPPPPSPASWHPATLKSLRRRHLMKMHIFQVYMIRGTILHHLYHCIMAICSKPVSPPPHTNPPSKSHREHYFVKLQFFFLFQVYIICGTFLHYLYQYIMVALLKRRVDQSIMVKYLPLPLAIPPPKNSKWTNYC